MNVFQILADLVLQQIVPSLIVKARFGMHGCSEILEMKGFEIIALCFSFVDLRKRAGSLGKARL